MKPFVKTFLLTSTFFLSALGGFSQEASAQTVFMVQLGSFESEDEARSHWEKLSKTFPDLFEPLTYAPTEVMLPPDDFVYHRTQAGPIATREEADSICQRVTQGGMECYVVETAMFTAPYDDKAPTAQAATAPVSEEEAETGFFEGLLGGDSEEEETETAAAPPLPVPPAPQAAQPAAAAPAPQPVAPQPAAPAPQPVSAPAPAAANTASPFASGPSVPAGGTTATSVYVAPEHSTAPSYSPAPAPAPQAAAASVPVRTIPQPLTFENVAGSGADVSVAEAIPVPLSSLNSPSATPYSSGFRGTPSSYSRTTPFWAEIGYFKSQNDALGYWNVLRSRDPAIPSGLRLRVTTPFQQRQFADKMSLRVGPFNNINAIRRLCSFTRAEKLGCRAVKDLGASISPAGERGRYAARRAAAPSAMAGRGTPRPGFGQARYESRGMAGAVSPASVGGEAMYWVQLGAFMAPQAASDKWAELQMLHKDVLGNLNEQINAPNRGGRSLFRLRAGPFARAADAVGTCEALKRKGTLCVVVSER